MRGIHVVQFIVLLAIIPSIVRGAEVTTTIGAGVRYESNVFRDSVSGEPVSDYGVTLNPSISISTPRSSSGFLNFGVHMTPPEIIATSESIA